MSLLLPLLFGFVAIVALAFAFAIYYKNQNSSPDSSSRDLIQENAGQKAQIDQQNKIIGQLTHDLQAEKSEKDQLSGKGKQLFVEITSLKEKLE